MLTWQLPPLLRAPPYNQVPGQEDEPVGPSFFWRTIEDDLGTIAHYYDAPVLSLRNAVYHLLREGRPGFQARVMHLCLLALFGLLPAECSAPPAASGYQLLREGRPVFQAGWWCQNGQPCPALVRTAAAACACGHRCLPNCFDAAPFPLH